MIYNTLTLELSPSLGYAIVRNLDGAIFKGTITIGDFEFCGDLYNLTINDFYEVEL